jgi:hypothetical protein
MFIQQLGSLIKDAFGHRMLTWEGSIGPRLAGMSIVSSLVNRDHAECPRCPEPLEDPPHILTCPAPSAHLCWTTALTGLEGWMTKQHTMPELQSAVLKCLHEWRHPNPHRLSRSSITSRYGLRAAVLEQDSIGWYNFLMGRPSARWSEVQQRYYEWLQRKNMGKAWTQALIKKIWAVS